MGKDDVAKQGEKNQHDHEDHDQNAAQQGDFLAQQPAPAPIRFFDFVPGVPFGFDPRNVVLLWEDFIAQRRNQPPPPPQEDEEILIFDINRRNFPR